MAEHQLAGLRVVVTRPREQAVCLAQRIEQLGGVPLLFPLLEITPVSDQTALHEQRARFSTFDLAVFISPNAVKYGMAAFAPLPDGVRIATVGQGSARALRAHGLPDIIAPHGSFDSEALLAMPELQDVSGWRVAILRGDGGREVLGDTLRARGATVEYITCYQRAKTRFDPVALMQATPDVVTVSSSEALSHLWECLDEHARSNLQAVPMFVPHPRIAELARRQGWRQVVVTDSGDDGVIAALIAWVHSHRS